MEFLNCANSPFKFSYPIFCTRGSSPQESRYYIADIIDSPSTLIISRGRFFDQLIRCKAKFTTFDVVYQTRIPERIYFVSADQSRTMFLIVLMRFGDGIDTRTNYCSIFVHCNDGNNISCPISKRSDYPQIVSWSNQTDSDVFVYTAFNEEISSYKLVYNEARLNFKIVFQQSIGDFYTFRSSYVSGAPFYTLVSRGASQGKHVQLKDYSKSGNPSQKQLTLPKFRLAENDEFKIFRDIKQQYGSQRCVLFTNNNHLIIILPLSQYYLQVPLDYLPKVETGDPEKNRLEKARSRINFDPIYAYLQPFTKLPFSAYINGFFIIAAPKSHITTFLVDHRNNPRYLIQTKIPSDDIHMMSSFSYLPRYALSQTTGQIFQCDLNYDFFIKEDPKYIIPLLHTLDFNHIDRFDFTSILNESCLETFWNCDIYNELLLLYFIYHCKKVNAPCKICTTFAKPYVSVCDPNVKFESYGIQITQTFNVNDIITSFPMLCKNKQVYNEFPTDVTNYVTLSRYLFDILENKDPNNTKGEHLDCPFFNYENYHNEIRFPVMLQIAAMKYCFGTPNNKCNNDFIKEEVFPKETNKEEIEYLCVGDMLPLDCIRKRKCYNENVVEKRKFWKIKCELIEKNVDLVPSKAVNGLENVTKLFAECLCDGKETEKYNELMGFFNNMYL